jgi:uncharacterized LabA/DUF88 family protein
MFLVDGQNLYHGCRNHFGHGNCHPHLLADELLEGRALAGVRFYTGIHDRRINGFAHAALTRRLDTMKIRGVETYPHPLKYSDVEATDPSVPPCDHGFHRVDVVRKGREKGIDLRIGLDMLRLARHREYDVAVLVSQDTDLDQAVTDLMALRDELGIWLVVENAIPYSPTSGYPKFHLPTCRRWHVIGDAMFARIRDDTDYTKPLKKS